MTVFKPPTPIVIASTGGGGSGGSSLNTGNASVVLNTNPQSGTSNMTFTTNNSTAMTIDESQNVMMGTTAFKPSDRLVVVATSTGNAISIVQGVTQSQAQLNISPSGTLSIRTSGHGIDLLSSTIAIDNNSLILGGTAVTTTALQLNSLSITPGVAAPLKAMVLDSDSSITGINLFGATTLTGTLLTAYQPNINRVTNLAIDSAFTLGGTNVLSTAIELNYNHVIPGVASASKALILNSNSSISGINLLSADQLTGVIQTVAQPNITSVGVLSNLNVSTTIGIGTTNPSTDLELYNVSNPTIKLNNGTYASNITIDTNGNLFLNSHLNVFIRANKSIQLSGTGEIAGANRVSANYLSGLIETAAQPNITSIGTLNTLLVNGYVGVGVSESDKKMEIRDSSGSCLRLSRTSLLYTDLLINSNGDLQLLTTGDIILSTNTNLRFNSGTITGLNSIIANELTGTLLTVAQPNITSIGTLGSLTVSNNITADSLLVSSIEGTLQTATQPNITSLGTLGSLTVSNSITSGSIFTNNITGTLQTATQNNITSIGTLGSLVVTNNISAGSLSASTIVGTISTSNQPNITTIGILTNLTVSNTLNVGTINSTNIYGQIQTASQTNITSVGTLISLDVLGTMTAGSVSASTLTGVIQTASQNNITSIGTLGSLSVTNNITAGSLSASTLTGTLQTVAQPNIISVGILNHVYTSGQIGINQTNPTFDIDINSTGGKLLQGSYNTHTIDLSISSTGDCILHTNSNNLILSNGTGLNFIGGGIISGLSNLTASTLSGTIQTAAQPNITSIGALSTLSTESISIGSNHSSSYDLSILSTSGNLFSLSDGSTTVTHQILANDYIISSTSGNITLDANMDLVLNGGTILGMSTISATSLVGTIQTAAQPNITSLGTLTGLTINGQLVIGTTTIIENDIHLIQGITPGTASAGRALVVDSNRDIISIRNLSATNLTGTIQTASQPNITSLGALSSITLGSTTVIETDISSITSIISGNASADKALVLNSSSSISGINLIGATSLALGGNVLAATEASYLTSITSGTASISKALVLNSSGSISGINSLGATQMTLGNSSNTTMPLEIGFVPFVMTSAYAYNTNANSHGTIAAGGATSYNYSIRALGRILCTQSVDVTSDRRLKYNVQNLNDAYCTKFVTDTTPVSFNWINGDDFPSYGYIAQDLLRNGFDDLVNLADDKNMNQEIDSDGLISPQGIKFTISYQHIIPILAQNQKRLMRENKELSDKVDKLMDLINQLTQPTS